MFNNAVHYGALWYNIKRTFVSEKLHLPNYLATEAEPLPGRLCNCTNLRILSTRRMAAIDPMDVIQPSMPAASEAGDHPDAEMPDQQHVRVHEDNGPMIVLAKTPDGIRTLLGRKKRRRPTFYRM